MSEDRIPTSEHVAHMIETGEWFRRTQYGSDEFSTRGFETQDGLAALKEDEEYWKSPEYFYVSVTIRRIFPNSISLCRASVDLPITKQQKRRIVDAVLTRRKLEKNRQAKAAAEYKEKRQWLLWYP